MKIQAKKMIDYIAGFLPYRRNMQKNALLYQIALAAGDMEAAAVCYKARAACSPFSGNASDVPEDIQKRIYQKLNFSCDFGAEGAWSRLSAVMQNVVDKAISCGNESAIRMKALAYAWDTPLKNHFDAGLEDKWTQEEKAMVDRFLSFVKEHNASLTIEMRQVVAGTCRSARELIQDNVYVKGIRCDQNDLGRYSAGAPQIATAEERKKYATLCAFRDCQKHMLDNLAGLEQDSLKMHFLAGWLKRQASNCKTANWSNLSEKLNMWAASLGNYAARRVLSMSAFPSVEPTLNQTPHSGSVSQISTNSKKDAPHSVENCSSGTMGVELLSLGPSKMAMIKLVRSINPKLSLATAKALLESLPSQIAQNMSLESAKKAVGLLASEGAQARVVSNK